MTASSASTALSRTLVIGLGVTGLSCVRHLAARGVPLAVADTRDAPPGLDTLRDDFPDIAVFLGSLDERLFDNIDRVIVSPGVPLANPALEALAARGVPVLGDIELFVHEARAPVVAITGSNGKSTVTTLVGDMARASGLRVAVGGNLGTPALDLLDDGVELYVLELSSFQLESTHSLRAAVACVLNVSADHMDRYDSVEAYAAAKQRVLHDAGVAVLNADDARVAAMTGADDTWLFTLGDAVDDKTFGTTTIGDELYLCRGERPLLAAAEVRMPGRHNLANVLAALAMGSALGFDEPAMRRAVTGFAGLPHRSQWVAEHAGITWINDSKATNVGAAIAALQGLHDDAGGRTVLIAGGDGKGADFSALTPVLATCVRAVVLLGRDAERIAAIVPSGVTRVHAVDMDAAVAQAAQLARAGDRVLLSPACASLDMFSGYAERGETFMRAVRRITR